MTVNDTLSKFVIFAAGAAIGSVVTWKCLKTKYQRIAQEEIDSVKEVFANRDKYITDVKKSEPESKETNRKFGEETIQAYKDILNVTNYAGKEVTEVDANKPYVISPEEFGEIPEYEQITLTLYADMVLTDDANEPIEDVDSVVGRDSLNHFGEYEDDSVHVRNDEKETDYEILRVLDCFYPADSHRAEE